MSFNWFKCFRKRFRKQPKTLYVIRGISGSGKSSLGTKLTRWAIAADDFPGLYIDGKYQLSQQKASHQWCESQVERWMKKGKKTIAVCNTAVKRKYYQKYIDLALSHSYGVQVIACEALIKSDGTLATNVHGVPADILERQKQNWEVH